MERGLVKRLSPETTFFILTIFVFISTLCISETLVTKAIRKKSDKGIVKDDQRGKLISGNKIFEFVKQGVRDYIKKFPVLESHYTRERSARKYLGNELNINRMYELYKTDRMGLTVF